MPYYRCPDCGLTLQSVAGRFTAKTCPKCSVPLSRSDQTYVPERAATAMSCRFLAEPKAASAARGELDTLLWNLDPDEHQIAALLITELIANSVEHAGVGTRAEVRLDVALSDELVRVEVHDEGSGFVPASRTADSPLDSQWGLHLVESLADRWEVVAEPHTVVWFELDRPPSAGARQPCAAPGELALG
jgi:anti-sigma regulatory factor (Ser/Thr protein kinase)